MPKLLFRFVKKAESLAQKRGAASPKAVAGDPPGHGFAGWKHFTLHFMRIHMDASYREVVDWASEMDRVRALVQLARTKFPAPSTCCGLSSGFPPGFGANCSTARRPDAIPVSMGHWMPHSSTATRHPATPEAARIANIRTLKTTALVDTDSCAVLDLHMSAHWCHDTQVGRRVALRNTETIDSLADDKG